MWSFPARVGLCTRTAAGQRRIGIPTLRTSSKFKFKAQLWFISGQLAFKCCAESCATNFCRDLHLREYPQYEYHWHDDPVPWALELHRKHQQDALRLTWVGLVAGSDGSVDVPSEKMGAGYVIGDAGPVGGRHASIRAEAASPVNLSSVM